MIVDKRRGSSLYPVISGEKKGAWAAAMRVALAGMATAYEAGMNARMRKYHGMEKYRAGVPVISVGNITLGGTGKTPVCRFLARRLERHGKKVGIATRGYGREGGGTAVLASGKDIESWHHCGDEAVLFIRGTKDITVAVDIDRTAAVRTLEHDHACGVILLDDGYQFVSLHRDVNIAVLDGYNPLGFEKLVPAGLLREPVGSLERADVFWLAKADAINPAEKKQLFARLAKKFPDKPFVESVYKPLGFSSPSEPGNLEQPDSLSGAKTLCVSGIGNPESFENLVQSLTGVEPLCWRFTDHHPFGGDELDAIEREAEEAGVNAIVTTEKDAVRLPEFFKPDKKWRVLEIGVSITGVSGDMGGAPLLEKIL